MTGQRTHWIYQLLYLLLFLSIPGVIYILWLNYFVYNLNFLKPHWFMNLKPQLFCTYGYTGIPALIAGLFFAISITSRKYLTCVVLTVSSYFAICLASYGLIFIAYSKPHGSPILNSGQAPAYNLYDELVQTFYISPFILFNLFGLILIAVLATLLTLRLKQRHAI